MGLVGKDIEAVDALKALPCSVDGHPPGAAPGGCRHASATGAHGLRTGSVVSRVASVISEWAEPEGKETDELIHEGHSSWPTAALHLVTAIIGAGVLTLPNAVSWMGWLFGMPTILIFYLMTMYTSLLLTDVYKVDGRRNPRYIDAVRRILGPKHAAVLTTVQMVIMALATLGLTIAGANSLSQVAKYGCQYSGRANCPDKMWQTVLIFGILQMFLSQCPNLESVWVVSAVGAACSLGYSVIALALGASSLRGGGSLWGREAPPFEKAMGVFGALGDVSVSFFCAMIILEVQDTLRQDVPGGPVVAMRKSVSTALSLALSLFIMVSGFGYSALGDTVPESVLDAKWPHAPGWVPMAANIMICLHMVAAVQIYAQVLFTTVELWLSRPLSHCGLSLVVSDLEAAARPRARRLAAASLRVGVRCALIGVCMMLAVLVPSFSAVIGLIGALLFWPAGVFYPIALWSKVYNPCPRTRLMLAALSAVMLLVSAAGTVGSVYQIVRAASGAVHRY